MVGCRSHRGKVCITLPLWLLTIWGWVGGTKPCGSTHTWITQTELKLPHRCRLSGYRGTNTLTCARTHTHRHTRIQLNLPQDYSYTRPDDQANCVPLFDGTCCVVVSKMAFSCLLRAVCLFGKWWFQGSQEGQKVTSWWPASASEKQLTIPLSFIIGVYLV